jgi:hypothetical protein
MGLGVAYRGRQGLRVHRVLPVQMVPVAGLAVPQDLRDQQAHRVLQVLLDQQDQQDQQALQVLKAIQELQALLALPDQSG